MIINMTNVCVQNCRMEKTHRFMQQEYLVVPSTDIFKCIADGHIMLWGMTIKFFHNQPTAYNYSSFPIYRVHYLQSTAICYKQVRTTHKFTVIPSQLHSA